MMDMKSPPPNSTMLTAASEQPEYPYGLRISLGPDSLKTLAIGSGNLPQVGQPFMLHAMAEVVSVSRASGDTEDSHQVDLQITTMELLPPEAMNEQQASHAQISRMYD